MARYLVNVHFLKVNKLKICVKIKFRNESNWFFFEQEHQHLCLHIDKIKHVSNFVKYKTLNLNLNRNEFCNCFNFSSNRFEFRNHRLQTEKEYRLNPVRSYAFSECLECINSIDKITKSIRKRKKLTDQDKIRLSFDIGCGYSNRTLINKWELSKESIRKFKNELNFLNRSKPTKSSSAG